MLYTLRGPEAHEDCLSEYVVQSKGTEFLYSAEC